MKKDITKKRLLQLGQTLSAIINELEQSFDVPEPNPQKRRNHKAETRARVANKLDAHIEAKRRKQFNKK